MNEKDWMLRALLSTLIYVICMQEAELAREEKEAALEEVKMAQEMVEEMINSQNNNQSDDKLIEVKNRKVRNKRED